MSCKSSTLIYANTGVGKTVQCGSWAYAIHQRTNKKIRYYTAEPGGVETIQHLVDAGILEVWDISARPNFTESVEQASQGYWLDPKDLTKTIAPTAQTWETVGGLIYEGGTSFGEQLLEEMRVKAANNEIMAVEKPPQQYTSGSLRVAGSGMAHYGMAQARVRRAMTQSQRLPAHILWTCREVKASDEEMVSGYKEIFGPQIVGTAMTPHVPSWFGKTVHLHLVKELGVDPVTKKTIEKVVRKAFFKTHFIDNAKTPYVANPRLPVEVVDDLPESVTATSLTMSELLDTIDSLKAKAREMLKHGGKSV
jgi:hypothetical protein